jgi:hypothetical protein
MKVFTSFSFLRSMISGLLMISSIILSAQTTIYLDDFESYQGFGNIPTNFGGGMRVYATHGAASTKGLCINFSQFVSKDSSITPASAVLPAGCAFQFDYRYATYIGSFPGSGYDLTTDVFEVYVAVAGSGDFGSPLLTINASNHSTSVNFVSQSVDLSSFEGQSVQIKVKGVRGTVNDYWLDTDNYRIETTIPTSIAVEPTSLESINVFPNPANDVINVNFAHFNNPVKVEIMNMLGATVMKKTLNSASSQINLEELPKGIYYFKILGTEKDILKKVVLK